MKKSCLINLILARHGQALPSTVHPEEPLSEMGIAETKKVALLLKQSGVTVDEGLHSLKLRAKQTAEILGSELAPHLAMKQKEGLRPNDLVLPLAQELEITSQSTLIVSHLPFLSHLTSLLLTGKQDLSLVQFTPSSIVCLHKGEGTWQIAWMVSPTLLGEAC